MSVTALAATTVTAPLFTTTLANTFTPATATPLTIVVRLVRSSYSRRLRVEI